MKMFEYLKELLRIKSVDAAQTVDAPLAVDEDDAFSGRWDFERDIAKARSKAIKDDDDSYALARGRAIEDDDDYATAWSRAVGDNDASYAAPQTVAVAVGDNGGCCDGGCF